MPPSGILGPAHPLRLQKHTQGCWSTISTQVNMQVKRKGSHGKAALECSHKGGLGCGQVRETRDRKWDPTEPPTCRVQMLALETGLDCLLTLWMRLNPSLRRGREDGIGQRSPAAKKLQPKPRLLPAFVGSSSWPSNISTCLDMVTAVGTCHHCCGNSAFSSIYHLHLPVSKQAQPINTAC